MDHRGAPPAARRARRRGHRPGRHGGCAARLRRVSARQAASRRGGSPGVPMLQINCVFLLAIVNWLGYPCDILVGVTSMSSIFTTLTYTKRNTSAGVAFRMSTTRVADSARSDSVLA